MNFFFQSRRSCLAGYPRLPHADRRSLMIEGGIRRCIDWPNYTVAYDSHKEGNLWIYLYNLLYLCNLQPLYLACWVQPSMMFDFEIFRSWSRRETDFPCNSLCLKMRYTIEMVITRSNRHSPVDFGAFPHIFQVFTSQKINKWEVINPFIHDSLVK